ncbi:MAG: hypothetical protein KY456_16625 [Chloroflexi bacterium]|nr:hypothetical protein [Chloroflexota bacterium]
MSDLNAMRKAGITIPAIGADAAGRPSLRFVQLWRKPVEHILQRNHFDKGG